MAQGRIFEGLLKKLKSINHKVHKAFLQRSQSTDI